MKGRGEWGTGGGTEGRRIFCQDAKHVIIISTKTFVVCGCGGRECAVRVQGVQGG